MGSPFYPAERQKDLNSGSLAVTSFPELRVLAVDDSTLDRRLVERLLQRQSYKGKELDQGRVSEAFAYVVGNVVSVEVKSCHAVVK